jgi:prepilin-type processing-associated H-X9-DG protein
VVGIDAETGKFLWGYNRIASNVANITAPHVRGNYVFVTTAYNVGSALLEIKRAGDRFEAEEVYFLGPRDFQNHHGGVVVVGQHVFGGHRPNSGYPTCIDLATGEICWSERSLGRGSASVLYADGHVIFRYDRGEVFLVEATPDALRVKGQFTAVKGEGPAWAHPVIHRGRLYLRHGDVLGCYDLRAL